MGMKGGHGPRDVREPEQTHTIIDWIERTCLRTQCPRCAAGSLANARATPPLFERSVCVQAARLQARARQSDEPRDALVRPVSQNFEVSRSHRRQLSFDHDHLPATAAARPMVGAAATPERSNRLPAV
eukprot:131850-Chlamydomonas_euryale.AAC.3